MWMESKKKKGGCVIEPLNVVWDNRCCSEIHTNTWSVLCGKNIEFSYVNTDYSNHEALEG